MTFDLAQAEELLGKLVENSGVSCFAVSHNYTGYPLVRQAREMILSGELGEIQAIRSNYIQGWLRTRLETEDQKQACLANRPREIRSGGCLRRYRHACVQPCSLHDGSDYPKKCLPPQSVFEEGRNSTITGMPSFKFENGGLS